MKQASIIGAGGFGTAMATLLSETCERVCIWAYDAATAEEINTHHTNEVFLAGATLPRNITATSDLAEALKSELILFVTPSEFTRGMAEKMAQTGVAEDAIIVSCTKGIEFSTNKLMSQVLEECLPGRRIAVLSGPNHAEEIAHRIPAAAVIGSSHIEILRPLQAVFSLPTFRVYRSDDMVGIQLGGALKNVFALAAGISDGLAMGDSTKAALVTRALAEMMRIGMAMGGRQETFFGLSGIGDLMATCFSRHSRNRRVGERIGCGETLDDIRGSSKMVAEGVPTARAAWKIAQHMKIAAPLTEQVHAILFEGQPPRAALTRLFARPLRHETDSPLLAQQP